MGVKSINRIQRYAKENCATFCGENGCHLEPGGDERCLYFNGLSNQRCRYFETHVLPGDPVLAASYFASFGIKAEDGAIDRCERCDAKYIRKSNRQKYCSDCSESKRRERNRNNMRKVRENVYVSDEEHVVWAPELPCIACVFQTEWITLIRLFSAF